MFVKNAGKLFIVNINCMNINHTIKNTEMEGH